MIEEFMKRHEVLENVACFGFRDDIDKGDPRLDAEAVEKGSLGQFQYDFNHDSRIAEGSMRNADISKIRGTTNLSLSIQVETGRGN